MLLPLLMNFIQEKYPINRSVLNFFPLLLLGPSQQSINVTRNFSSFVKVFAHKKAPHIAYKTDFHKTNCLGRNLSYVTYIWIHLSVKTCGPPRIDDAVMSNITVKPGQKVVFNCKVTLLISDIFMLEKSLFWCKKSYWRNPYFDAKKCSKVDPKMR